MEIIIRQNVLFKAEGKEIVQPIAPVKMELVEIDNETRFGYATTIDELFECIMTIKEKQNEKS